MTITVAMAGLIAVAAADYLLAPLPAAARIVLSAAWLVATLAAVRCGFGPMFKPIGLLQVARWLETRHPEMQERLSTVLELSHQGSGVSAELLESLAHAAEADAGTVNADVEVRSARTSLRWGRPASVLTLLLLLALVIWPREATRLFVRAVAPLSDRGNAAAGRFQVSPGDIELLAGDSLRVETRYHGRHKNLEIAMDFENGERLAQPMSRGETFTYTLDPVKRGFRYRLRAGREESDAYTVTVWPMPEIQQPRVKLEYPAYTGVMPVETSLDRGIEAVAGTKVTLSGRVNTPVAAGWLAIDERHLSQAALDASSGRLRFEWQLMPGGSGEAVATLKHRLGREIGALRLPVEVLEDHPPEVVLLNPMQRDLKVRPDELLEMRYEATEDFALAKVAVEADAGSGEAIQLEQLLPDPVERSRPLRFRGDAPVAIGALRAKFPGAGTLRLRIRAQDGRPAEAGGPGIGFSEWVTLRITNGAESLARQELRQEHEGAKQQIEEAIRATREAREGMDRHRDAVKRNVRNEHARKDLKEAGEKLAAAQEKLDELSKRMEASVHATKAGEVRKAAEWIAEAREDFESAPLQDRPEERDAKLQEARDEAECRDQAIGGNPQRDGPRAREDRGSGETAGPRLTAARTRAPGCDRSRHRPKPTRQ